MYVINIEEVLLRKELIYQGMLFPWFKKLHYIVVWNSIEDIATNIFCVIFIKPGF